MSNPLKLVSGDNLPNVQVTMTDKATGVPVDISDPATLITVKMRALGSTAILATLPGTLVTNGLDGMFTFAFPGNALNVPAGQYEFEINLNFGGNVQRVYDVIRAQIRSGF
jgi:hypothetical protein